MRSLTNSFVKRLHKTKRLRGSVQVERYHLQALRTPKEVNHAVNDVLSNRENHTEQQEEDLFSSQMQSFFLDEGKSWLLKEALALMTALKLN